jgi:iron(III) transport system ATP-binding protein
LRLITGALRPSAGEVLIGSREVTSIKASRRPLLDASSAFDVPARWSVQHALIAAVRQRTLDRQDRHREYADAVTRWRLGALLERTIRTLSSTERTLVALARIELLRPAILIADRLLGGVNPSMAAQLADDFYRTLRIMGTTVVSSPASALELGLTDRIVVLRDGAVVQEGSAYDVFTHPRDEAAALATGEVNVVPVTVAGTVVESAIGAWDVPSAPFQGSGVALARPDAFTLAAKGEESDLIFGVEEASFRDGRWHLTGYLTGGLLLRVALTAEAQPGVQLHKGRLLALRYDPRAFRLLPRSEGGRPGGVPTDVVPPMAESR